MGRERYFREPSGQQLLHHLPADIRKPEIAAHVAIRELGVIHTLFMQNGGLLVVLLVIILQNV